jgi:protein-disulfide isomerase
MNRLKALILQKLMDHHPDKKNLTNDAFLEKYILTHKKISEKEFKDFTRQRAIPDSHLTDDIKSRIKNYLKQEQKRKDIENFVSSNKKKYKVEVFLKKPKRPIFSIDASNAPYLGKKNASVTIVEYSDFQCPYSKKGSEIMKKIKHTFKNRVKLVHKNFPLPFHKNAKDYALASLCAWEQGNKKFWNFYHALYQNQTQTEKSFLTNLAKEQGLNPEKFDSCFKNQRLKNVLEEQIQQANRLGIKSTPTFYINGKVISGAQNFEVFEKLINEELSLSKKVL